MDGKMTRTRCVQNTVVFEEKAVTKFAFNFSQELLSQILQYLKDVFSDKYLAIC